MKHIIRLSASILLASTIVVLNGIEVLQPRDVSRQETNEALFLPIPKNFKWATAHYDTGMAANFLGCEGPPDDCLMIVLPNSSVAVTPTGIYTLAKRTIGA